MCMLWHVLIDHALAQYQHSHTCCQRSNCCPAWSLLPRALPADVPGALLKRWEWPCSWSAQLMLAGL